MSVGAAAAVEEEEDDMIAGERSVKTGQRVGDISGMKLLLYILKSIVTPAILHSRRSQIVPNNGPGTRYSFINHIPLRVI